MIRQMTAQDIAHVQHIAHTTWLATYDDLIPKNLKMRFLDNSYSDMMLMKRLEKTILLILQHEDGPIGFINFTETDADGDAELISIHVLPHYQLQGYGKKLIRAMQEALTDTFQLFAYINHKNVNTCKFYETAGFRLIQVFEEQFEGHPVETAEYVFSFNQQNVD